MFDWFTGRNKELEAHRARRVDALVDAFDHEAKAEAVHPATRLKELDRIYRELEAHFDSRVKVLDELQGNGDRGARGPYYFPTVKSAVNGIRRMYQNIEEKNAEILLEQEKIRRVESAKTYSHETELEINGICAALGIEGIKTL